MTYRSKLRYQRLRTRARKLACKVRAYRVRQLRWLRAFDTKEDRRYRRQRSGGEGFGAWLFHPHSATSRTDSAWKGR